MHLIKNPSSPYLNRFVQPDTIIPDPSNPQSWNRYSYVANRPVVLNDPTGHETGSMCDRGYMNYCSPVIFFGGSDPTDPEKKGPLPQHQSQMWTTDERGESIATIQYPGGETAKADQAELARGYHPDETVDIIGYSGGTESALMYALWRLENGQPVNSAVLLGPTFETSTKNFDEPDGGWSAVLDTLLNAGVDVYVLDDGSPWNKNEASKYKPPSTATGSWVYDDRWFLKHHSSHPRLRRGTNNDEELKDEIYDWLAEN